MLMNAMIVESFGIRGGKIHEVEAMPFVTIPYGLGDGWTEGSGVSPIGHLAISRYYCASQASQ
jgi:hypothetical protein